jgi:hypothetical protein
MARAGALVGRERIVIAGLLDRLCYAVVMADPRAPSGSGFRGWLLARAGRFGFDGADQPSGQDKHVSTEDSTEQFKPSTGPFDWEADVPRCNTWQQVQLVVHREDGRLIKFRNG